MSDMERNKGLLIPECIDIEEYTEEDFDTLYDNGFLVIDGEVYSVHYEIRREKDSGGFAEVEVQDNGTIKFHTYHYNGGGSLGDVIEEAYRKLEV
tara:strand:+ start:12562 stop:12846 length:285 start_codon:yes stop_codon:yes gene_type:complete